jgi:serine/threonine protein kinase
MVQGPRVAGLIAAAQPGETPPWLATEYVPGITLAEYVKEKGALSKIMAAALGTMLTEALADIHAARVLHRDFKPGNIILSEDGPKVIDFGLVALADEQGDITKTADVLGTPHCMAPEQARTPKDVTEAIDIYALGAVLTFAITGHYLYDRPSMPALLFAIADPGTEPDLSGVPEQLKEPITRMLAHDPHGRPSLAEVTGTLDTILASHGKNTADAQRELARLTYIVRDTDPPPVVQPRQGDRGTRMATDAHVPTALVRDIAESLRKSYAREAAA